MSEPLTADNIPFRSDNGTRPTLLPKSQKRPTLDQAHTVCKRRLGDGYDPDARGAVFATAAA